MFSVDLKQPLNEDLAGLRLYAVQGRILGDDDDSVFLVWARTLPEASDKFVEKLFTLDGVNPDDEYIIISTEVAAEVSADGSSLNFPN